MEREILHRRLCSHLVARLSTHFADDASTSPEEAHASVEFRTDPDCFVATCHRGQGTPVVLELFHLTSGVPLFHTLRSAIVARNEMAVDIGLQEWKGYGRLIDGFSDGAGMDVDYQCMQPRGQPSSQSSSDGTPLTPSSSSHPDSEEEEGPDPMDVLRPTTSILAVSEPFAPRCGSEKKRVFDKQNPVYLNRIADSLLKPFRNRADISIEWDAGQRRFVGRANATGQQWTGRVLPSEAGRDEVKAAFDKALKSLTILAGKAEQETAPCVDEPNDAAGNGDEEEGGGAGASASQATEAPLGKRQRRKKVVFDPSADTPLKRKPDQTVQPQSRPRSYPRSPPNGGVFYDPGNSRFVAECSDITGRPRGSDTYLFDCEVLGFEGAKRAAIAFRQGFVEQTSRRAVAVGMPSAPEPAILPPPRQFSHA
ncbi:unnamed protein product [Vitrella brassicaformis CCMP3155]|uniref:Uncharacterized protein n=1 Tax=Vitrella brassicaformis (strain CCMP3155) TaxID=1169540 RepID=A0A0G4ELD0_VITBC|nr:unnamed protein product [Vitrella brassicaformis CCMP3155]|eukprot:CEL97580.1 unnamed protein product [Vitrella brassicaformis CCMP3155]